METKTIFTIVLCIIAISFIIKSQTDNKLNGQLEARECIESCNITRGDIDWDNFDYDEENRQIRCERKCLLTFKAALLNS